MDEFLVAGLAEGDEGPTWLLLFRPRGPGRKGGGDDVLGEAELTVPGQARGGELGGLEFDGSARFDRVDEEGFNPPWPRLPVWGGCRFWVLGGVFIREIGMTAEAQLLAAP